MKKTTGGESLINTLLDLSKSSINGYEQYNDGKRKTLIIFLPSLIEDIFTKQQRYFSRGITFIKMKNFFGNGLITSDGENHLKNKRVIQQSFNKKYFDSFLNESFYILDEIFMNLDGTISLSKVSDKFSFDSVSQCFLNKKFSQEYIDIYHEISDKIANIPHLKFNDEDTKNFKKVRDDLEKYIIENNSSHLIRDMKNGGMSNGQILDEVVTRLGAGFETTSALNVWTIVALNQHEEILSQLRHQIPGWVKENRPPKFEELFQSELMNNVIKETLRMYPPAYFSTRMVSDDFNFDGIEVSNGDNIFLSQYVAHRNGMYYNSPDEWNPYRWTEEFEKNLPRGAYFPFGHGSKKCIGEHFAKSLAYMFVLMFVHRYNFSFVEEATMPEYLVSMIPSGDVMIHLEKNSAG